MEICIVASVSLERFSLGRPCSKLYQGIVSKDNVNLSPWISLSMILPIFRKQLNFNCMKKAQETVMFLSIIHWNSSLFRVFVYSFFFSNRGHFFINWTKDIKYHRIGHSDNSHTTVLKFCKQFSYFEVICKKNKRDCLPRKISTLKLN